MNTMNIMSVSAHLEFSIKMDWPDHTAAYKSNKERNDGKEADYNGCVYLRSGVNVTHTSNLAINLNRRNSLFIFTAKFLTQITAGKWIH